MTPPIAPRPASLISTIDNFAETRLRNISPPGAIASLLLMLVTCAGSGARSRGLPSREATREVSCSPRDGRGEQIHSEQRARRL